MNFLGAHFIRQGVITPWKQHKYFTFSRQLPPQIRLLAVLR